MHRIEIVSDRRRAHDPAFRAHVVANSYVPGTRIRELAARHGIYTSLVYRWRRERVVAAVVKTRSALRLVPVQLVDELRAAGKQPDQSRPLPPPTPKAAAKPALIEIEFPGGRTPLLPARIATIDGQHAPCTVARRITRQKQDG
ncbi:transposase (plasmid) [Lichenicola cladoniae]|uniref:Transposase n=1 Tax=Lichenicola cladoniae TaxID=1484109 RepID=A0A6M8I011_9PROT|nr:transposase [Lichenicola cladoniae]NPD69301.1 transposase [Acetobacteraceae bacterium]QKE93888.1 transposase [Lichenicola cladoniae]